MSRTDMDAATLARSLRRMAGDGGMEWCYEPMQTSVLLDVADLLDENVKLRELCKKLLNLCYDAYEQRWGWDDDWALAYGQAKKLGVEESRWLST